MKQRGQDAHRQISEIPQTDPTAADLTQQCRFHITALSVSYQGASSILTEGQISDRIAKWNLTFDPVPAVSTTFPMDDVLTAVSYCVEQTLQIAAFTPVALEAP